MRTVSHLHLAAALAFACPGCAETTDLRATMERSASPPEGLLQTQFAHIGAIDVPEGRYQVAVQRLVCTGMLAPRGQQRLLLFDSSCRIAAEYSLMAAEPLWCERSRIYLFGCGWVPGVPCDPDLESLFDSDDVPVGNVIEFAGGLNSPVLTAEKRYGSSGGIEDDPRPAAPSAVRPVNR